MGLKKTSSKYPAVQVKSWVTVVRLILFDFVESRLKSSDSASSAAKSQLEAGDDVCGAALYICIILPCAAFNQQLHTHKIVTEWSLMSEINDVSVAHDYFTHTCNTVKF